MMLSFPLVLLAAVALVFAIVVSAAALLFAKRCADEAAAMKASTEEALEGFRSALPRFEESIDRLREDMARSPVIEAADRIEDVAETLSSTLDRQAEVRLGEAARTVDAATGREAPSAERVSPEGGADSGPAREAASAKGASEAISRYLAERGYGEVAPLGGGDFDAPTAGSARVSLTARRAGIAYKGFAKLEDGRVVDAVLAPTVGIFP